MKRIWIFIVVMILGLAACKKNEENKVSINNLPAGTHAVKVLDFMDVANYTYLQVSENGNEYWIAAPQTKVEKGETIYYSQGMEMKNFHSETLNRTFQSIFFVQSISSSPQAQTQTLSSAHQQVSSTQQDKISIEPLKDGKTIAQVYSQKEALSGKIIKIKGKVVKYNPNIMDRNWIHIQDGTKSGGNFDLLVTSKNETALGEIIVVEGRVALNKDFGAGYSYSVMLEDAKIISGKPI
ncbi:MAG: hypothetical protein M1480_15705 [Bacteroidetes bacterium]|nr:hypothetical protein [Bacteroidota bacterium]